MIISTKNQQTSKKIISQKRHTHTHTYTQTLMMSAGERERERVRNESQFTSGVLFRGT